MFLDYKHSSSQTTDVTFNLKDFKALLVLCEGLGANVAICFDQPGSPLLVHPVFHSNNPLVRLLGCCTDADLVFTLDRSNWPLLATCCLPLRTG